MAELLQCDSCGAVLGDEDLFCGECGAPRPASAPPSETPEAAAPAPPAKPLGVSPTAAPTSTPPRSAKPTATPAPRPARKTGPSPSRRQVAVVVAGLLAAVALALLILGLVVAFLIPQSDVGQAGTPDMILGATVICFCPGALALTAALVLWLVFIRRR